ncbi:unnamed protein product [Vicia faba]|uniref:Uncharacterized protein n=1 Tax=Vicia faba TaxID=3906 RepID=A0AAV0ZZG0_VICFA|nr:unnamed protein product [Vicia faba]
MWHSPQEVDRVLNHEVPSQLNCDNMYFCHVNFSDFEGDSNSNVDILDLLYGGFENEGWVNPLTSNEDECIYAILGEGFAKVLLLSDNRLFKQWDPEKISLFSY